MKTFTPLVALSAVALLLSSCQAPASSPMPVEATPSVPADAPLMIRVTEAGAALPALRELDVVQLQAPVAARLAMPIEYRSGVEEQVSWDGTGRGVAELTNHHGQLIYRVNEGGATQIVTVPAGRYTLTVMPDAAQAASPMLISAIPSEAGTGLSRELVDLAEVEGMGGDRSVAVGYCDGLREQMKRLADLERALQFRRRKAHFFPEYDKLSRRAAFREYMLRREQLFSDYNALDSGWYQHECGAEMAKHKPKVSDIEKAPLVVPFLFTYYMRTFQAE
ncbi:MAG: hypothetical protein ACLGIN_02635 [Candidatus Sericytochromatia bacterium]